MANGGFIVYTSPRAKVPAVPLRLVTPDGEAHFIVRDEDRWHSHDSEPSLTWEDAVIEVFRRAGRPLPTAS